MSIGEMGFHWAKLLKSHGVEVLTYDKDRGEVSRKRGENAGVNSVGSMAELVNQAELIVSIVVPSAATRVAAKVAEAVRTAGRKDLLFLDANAISPMTADEIAETLRPAGVNFLDGGIIGSAARIGKGTIVYVSGLAASRLQALEEFKIPIKVLGANTNQASAFKVVYAGLTKGVQGLPGAHQKLAKQTLQTLSEPGLSNIESRGPRVFRSQPVERNIEFFDG